jgi:hypothetical protein
VIYRQEKNVYVPLFTRGSAVPPAIEVGSPFIVALQGDAAVVDVEQWRRPAHEYFRPVDRTALDNLRATCLVSCSAATPPLAFASLGVKQSGDVYTVTDRTLLTRVGRELAATLARCDGGKTLARTAVF